ncbi:hypothetical protein [Legionella fallonii]|uniref:Uncharacterized protein n=1 Tax=Legionella fallonii LLAP-10 TaxID=1212491 RepID=A0A098GA28_9GAMM|nr:hypothetical protein [Legionella fallonii]CEG58865.1 conserved protein of unknown function [Legionella fallonii LLAP-10]
MPTIVNGNLLAKKNKRKDYIEKRDYNSYQLYASDFKNIVSHYYEKHQIKILINGCTSSGLSIIAEKQEKIKEQIQLNDKYKYAAYLVNHWVERNSARNDVFHIARMAFNPFANHYNEIEKAIGSFLDEHGQIKQHLSENELADLDNICMGLSRKCIDLFNKKIDGYKINLLHDIEDVNLDKNEVLQEIAKIQNNLDDNEAVGYVFTNGHSIRVAHFEVLILTKDRIIKPVDWIEVKYRSITPSDIKGMYYLNICAGSEQLQPQTGYTESGTLGLLYLKELLKNKQQQLQEHTLTFSYYHQAKETKDYFFFPSPQSLRYSQSDRYNAFVKAMLEDTPTTIVDYKNETSQIKTLQGLLEESINIARQKNDIELVNQNLSILNNLPSFRRNWLAVYVEAEKRREAMDTTYLRRKENLYLAYRTQTMNRIANETKTTSLDTMFTDQLNEIEEIASTEMQEGKNLVSLIGAGIAAVVSTVCTQFSFFNTLTTSTGKKEEEPIVANTENGVTGGPQSS